MTIINTSPDRIIQLGYEGEDRVTVLRFRYSADWLENGEGIFNIRVRRHGEHTAYNAQLVTEDPEYNCLLMTVTNVELSVKGTGEMQVVYSGADFVKKSPIYSYNVSRAVDEAVDPPAQDVYMQIIESLSDLQTDVSGITEDIGQIENSIGALSALTTAKIGDLTELTTTAKTDLVSAINEVNSKSVDDVLSATSTNPVQNRVITEHIDSLNSTIDDLGESIEDVQTAVQDKADIQTVSALADAVNGLDSDVQGLQTTIQSKADTATVTALSGTVSGLQTAVQSKADAQTVTALSGTVTDLQTSKADKTYVDVQLDGKASTQSVSDLVDDVYDIYPTDTASGVIANFPDGANSVPVKSLTVAIEPVQDLHGYDNPWPAGGGKNLLKTDGLSYAPPSDTEWGSTRQRVFTPNSFCIGCSANNYYMPGQLTEYSVSENRVTVTTGGIAYGVNIPIIGLTVGETYTFSATAPEGNIQIGAWQQDGTWLSVISTGTMSTTRTFTVPKNAYFVLICLLAKTSNVQAVFTNIQLEKGSTATSWTPYSNICPISGWEGAKVYHSGPDTTNPNEIGITFPSEAGTVYGGTLDATNGTLTVDRAMADIGSLVWTYMSSYKYFATGSLVNVVASPTSSQTPIAGLLCTAYKTASAQAAGSGNVNGTIAVDTYKNLRIKDLAFTNADAWKSAFANQTIVYPLATPQTYQLTPTEIRTLLGQNNIWADAGDTTVEYRANTSAYIAKKIAEAISALS